MAYRNIAITGASSGLGRALALGLAGPGVTLHLMGRDAERLAEVEGAVRARGAQADVRALDVTDAPAMEAWVRGCLPLDLVIANAGISAGPGQGNLESAGDIRAVLATNLDGVFNTVLPAMEGKVRRIVLIGSIAGLIALPASPVYCAGKAALDFWVRAAAPGAAREGIGLTLVRPGFIRTRLTAKNPFKMPGLMTAEQAAAHIIAGIETGATLITFPWWLAALARFGERFPKKWLARLPGKPAQT